MALIVAMFTSLAGISVALIGFGRLDLALASTAFVVASFALMRGAVAQRAALRTLVTHFGASQSGKPDGTPKCRLCDAPLPAAEERELISRCAYCGADNVLGFDIRRARTSLTTSTSHIAAALSEISDERRRMRSIVAICFGVLELTLAWPQ